MPLILDFASMGIPPTQGGIRYLAGGLANGGRVSCSVIFVCCKWQERSSQFSVVSWSLVCCSKSTFGYITGISFLMQGVHKRCDIMMLSSTYLLTAISVA